MTVAIVLHRADGAPVATPFRRTAFGTDDPFVGHREIAWEGPDSMIVGRTSFVGELEVASFPHIETIVVVEGELILTAAGRPRWCSVRERVLSSDAAPRFASRPNQACGFRSARPLATNRRSPALSSCAPTPTSNRLLRYRLRLCLARRRNAATTPSSPVTARITVRALGIRPHTTGLFARIARTSSCICWPGVYDSPRPMAACCRRAPEMRFSCPRAHLSDGKATIAWRSFSWSKASRPDVERDPSCPLARSLSFRPRTQSTPLPRDGFRLQPTSPL